MCIDRCTDMRVQTCVYSWVYCVLDVDTCVDLCVDVCIDVRTDVCVGVSIGVPIGTRCVHKHVFSLCVAASAQVKAVVTAVNVRDLLQSKGIIDQFYSGPFLMILGHLLRAFHAVWGMD